VVGLRNSNDMRGLHSSVIVNARAGSGPENPGSTGSAEGRSVATRQGGDWLDYNNNFMHS